MFEVLCFYEGAAKFTSAARDAAQSRENAAAVDGTTGPPTEERFSSVGRTKSGEPVAVIERDIFKNVPQSGWLNKVKTELRLAYPNGLRIGNSDIKINSKSISEIFNSQYSQNLKNSQPLIFADKLRAAAQAGDVIRAANSWINEGLKHPRTDNIISFARGEVLLRIGAYDYSAEVVIGYTSGDNMLLYDIVAIKQTANLGKIKYSSGATALTTNGKDAISAAPTATVSDVSIRDFAEDSKGGPERFSMEAPASKALEHNKTALEHFGRTSQWIETGYLPLDGKKLNFSGKHNGGPGGYRTADHRDISDALGLDYGDDSYSGAMVQFMSEGNSIMPENNGINLSVAPTKRRCKRLSKKPDGLIASCFVGDICADKNP